jgi:hypothetical protein
MRPLRFFAIALTAINAVVADSVMASRRCSGVVVAHPLNELAVLDVAAKSARQNTLRVARSAANERIYARGFRESRFDRDGSESHLLDQKAKQPIPEGHGLVSAAHGLSESNYTRRAYH